MCVLACMRARACVRVCVRVYVCACVRACVCVCACVCICVCVCVRACMCVCTRAHVHRPLLYGRPGRRPQIYRAGHNSKLCVQCTYCITVCVQCVCTEYSVCVFTVYIQYFCVCAYSVCTVYSVCALYIQYYCVCTVCVYSVPCVCTMSSAGTCLKLTKTVHKYVGIHAANTYVCRYIHRLYIS